MELPKSVPSWRGLQGKLGRLDRLNIFDNRAAAPVNFTEMLQPGRVSILDLSDTERVWRRCFGRTHFGGFQFIPSTRCADRAVGMNLTEVVATSPQTSGRLRPDLFQ
jgi:hypothetical protein